MKYVNVEDAEMVNAFTSPLENEIKREDEKAVFEVLEYLSLQGMRGDSLQRKDLTNTPSKCIQQTMPLYIFIQVLLRKKSCEYSY